MQAKMEAPGAKEEEEATKKALEGAKSRCGDLSEHMGFKMDEHKLKHLNSRNCEPLFIPACIHL